MKLGLVTYNIAKEWDIPTIIERCEATGFQGVELRTTHAHNVEVNLSAAERRNVRNQFEDSAIELAGLGSAFELSKELKLIPNSRQMSGRPVSRCVRTVYPTASRSRPR